MIQPTKTPRSYQKDFITSLSKSVVENTRVVACSPTGSGKSLTMMVIAWRALQKPNRAVFVISETYKIYEQLRDESGGIPIADGVKFMSIEPGNLYVCMAQTLAKRQSIIDQINAMSTPPIIMVDEAHIGTPTKILTQLNENVPIIGFTATPDARSAKHLPEIYKDCVVCCQVDDLIQEGYLCSYEHKKRDGAVLGALKSRNGEYTEASQNIAFGSDDVYNALISDLKTFPYKKCVIYVASISQADNVCDMLNLNGIPASRYHSKLSDGHYQLARFTTLNEVNVIVTVAALTKGWDFPPIDLVVLLRKTKSLPLFLQMIGRGGRPIWDVLGNLIKSKFLCIDYGENWKEHGLWYQDRPWNVMCFELKKLSDDAVAPVAFCPNCESIVAASQLLCPYCQHLREPKLKKSNIGEIEDITAEYNELIGLRISELTPLQLSVYSKIKNKQSFCARVARSINIDYLKSFANFMNYKKSWVHRQQSMPKGYTDYTLR